MQMFLSLLNACRRIKRAGIATDSREGSALSVSLALLVVVASVLAGCGSTASSLPPNPATTPSPAAVATTTQAAPAPAPATSTSAATPNTSGSPSFVVNATTQDGDKVKIEGWFGSPLPAGESDIDQTAFSECPPPATDGRAIVVHLDLATTLETSLSGEVELNTGSAVAGTDYVMGYGSGAQCESEAEGTGAKLGTLQPHQSTDFTMWLVSVNAITPNDQHPSEKVLGARDWVMELPQVTVDGSSSLDGHLSATGPRVVTCETGGPLPSRSEYVAPIGSTSKRLHLAVCPATS